MKTMIMQTEKSSRWAAMLLATVVAIITSGVVANATQTITTPNAAFISYNLATGATSAAITPASNKSVLVMGCCTTFFNNRGVGQVTLLHFPTTNSAIGSMVWYGLESPGAITHGEGSDAGIHIVYINQPRDVAIEVAGPDTIRIHNLNITSAQVGNVTLIW
jgi:hypothetical protein